jgi:Family of unknown function (DUF6518)
MSDSAGEHHEAASVPRRRRGVAGIIVALAAAFAFGAVDQYLGSLRSAFLTEISGMSAPWLVVPFVVGAFQASRRRAALAGLAATWLSVLGYVVMIVSPMEGTHLGPRPAGLTGSWLQLSPHLVVATLVSQWLWFAGGLVAGPLFGWLGHLWRARRWSAAALLVVLPVLLEPAARWLVSQLGVSYSGRLAFGWPGYRPAVVAELVELAVGLVLTGVVVVAIARARGAPGRA